MQGIAIAIPSFTNRNAFTNRRLKIHKSIFAIAIDCENQPSSQAEV
jgi:hypothetical protein